MNYYSGTAGGDSLLLVLEAAIRPPALSIVVAESCGLPIGPRAVWLIRAQIGRRSRILSALASAKRLFGAE